MKVRHAHRPGLPRVSANSVTALGGIAALAAIIPGHAPGTPPGQVPAAPAAPQAAVSQPQDFRVAVARHRRYDSAMALYRVRAGDSISEVAVRKCHGQARDWTGIYAASRRAHLTAKNANMITVGQQLALDCRYLPSQVRFAPAPPPPPPAPVRVRAAVRTSSVTASSAAPVRHRVYASSGSGFSGNVSLGSYSGYEACVVARESGGRSQVMNASGHYGLFQFDYGTWVSGGGSAATFGHASVAEQNRVFAAVYAARGTQPWSPSDGC
jgi:hypothetical protein